MLLITGKWDKEGFVRKALIFALVAGPIWVVSVFCFLTDTITTNYEGFALDNNGLLYVGEAKGIGVYDNGEFVKTVYKGNALVWAFTVQDEKLYVAAYNMVEVMDLSGNLIETIDDSNASERKRLYAQRNVFVAGDARYVATNKFGFYRITKHSNGESETVFQTPILNFVLSTAIPVITIIAVIIFFTGYIKWLIEKLERK